MDRENDLDIIGKCPACGNRVQDWNQGYYCSNRDCRFVLWKENRFFEAIGKKLTKETAVDLLEHKSVFLEQCRSRRTGNVFDAYLVLDHEEDGSARFSLDFNM